MRKLILLISIFLLACGCSSIDSIYDVRQEAVTNSVTGVVHTNIVMTPKAAVTVPIEVGGAMFPGWGTLGAVGAGSILAGYGLARARKKNKDKTKS